MGYLIFSCFLPSTPSCFLPAFTRLDKSSERRKKALGPAWLPSQQTIVIMLDEHDRRRIASREMFGRAFRIGAGHHMAGLFGQRRTATTRTKLLSVLPVNQRSDIEEHLLFTPREDSSEFTKMDKSSLIFVEANDG